jgi:hypothetical protein
MGDVHTARRHGSKCEHLPFDLSLVGQIVLTVRDGDYHRRVWIAGHYSGLPNILVNTSPRFQVWTYNDGANKRSTRCLLVKIL